MNGPTTLQIVVLVVLLALAVWAIVESIPELMEDLR
jgi:hypothetical protein